MPVSLTSKCTPLELKKREGPWRSSEFLAGWLINYRGENLLFRSKKQSKKGRHFFLVFLIGFLRLLSGFWYPHIIFFPPTPNV